MPGRYSAHKIRFNRYLPAKPEPVPCRDRLWGLSVSHRPFCGSLPGMHPGPFRVMVYHTRSTGASGAYSLQRVLGAASRCLAGGLIHDRLGHHLMNGRRQPGEDAGCKIARMMIRSKNIGEVPMDGAVHTSSPHSYSVPKAGEKPWKNNPDTPPAYEEMEGKGKI